MKLLVLGCGSIGKRHASNFAKLADVAVYDTNRDAMRTLPVQTFDTLDLALAWQPDGVIVSTPHDTHLAMATRALQSGAHVLVEKPISHSLEGVANLIHLASQQEKRLHVVCNMRFHSAVAVLKQHLTRVGQPLFARAYYGNYLPNMRPDADYQALYAAHRSQGGGVIRDAIHEFDYLRWFFGSVHFVTAEAGKLSNLSIDVEDYAAIQLQHKNGIRTEVHLDYLQHCKRRGCEIIGDQGTLIWESERKQPEFCRVRFFSKTKSSWETLYENSDEPINKPYRILAEYFTQSLLEDVDVLANGDDGLRALHIAFAALESVETGKRVSLV